MSAESLQIVLSAVDNASRALAGVSDKIKSMTQLAGRFNKVGKTMQNVGSKMTVGVTAPIVAGLGASAKAAIDFESSMADVAKVAGFNQEQTQAFGLELRKMSRELPVSAAGLAAIAESGAQLGVAQDQLTDFTTITAKMGTAFSVSADVAGESIAKLMNVYGLNLDGVESMGDAINQISNNTAASAAEIVEAATRIGGVTQTFGLTSTEASALAATFIQMGNAPEVASTAINSMLPLLQAATGQTERFQDGLESVGISAEQMETMVADNATGAIDTLIKKLAELDPREQALAINQMFGAGADARALGTLANNAEAFSETLALVGNEAAFAGSMQEEFAVRSATTANQIQLLKNNAVDMGIAIGSVMLPAINNVVETLGPMIERFSDFAAANEGIVQIGIAVAGVIAVIGPLLVMFGTVLSSISTIIGVVTTLAPIISGVAAAITGAISLPAIAIAALVAGVIAAAIAIVRHWDAIKAGAAAMAAGVGNAMAAIASVVTGTLQSIASGAYTMGRNIVMGVVNGIRSGIGAARDAAVAMASAVRNVLPNSPVPEGPLKILNGSNNAGFKIAKMLADGMSQGSGQLSGAAGQSAGQIANGLAGGGGFSPSVTINVSGSEGQPETVASVIESRLEAVFARLYEQYRQDQERLSYG